MCLSNFFTLNMLNWYCMTKTQTFSIPQYLVIFQYVRGELNDVLTPYFTQCIHHQNRRKFLCLQNCHVLNAHQLEAFLQMHLIPRQLLWTTSSLNVVGNLDHTGTDTRPFSRQCHGMLQKHAHSNIITTIYATWDALRAQRDRDLQTEVMN